jgi:magnesium-transporting ATPase (P-type)
MIHSIFKIDTTKIYYCCNNMTVLLFYFHFVIWLFKSSDHSYTPETKLHRHKLLYGHGHYTNHNSHSHMHTSYYMCTLSFTSLIFTFYFSLRTFWLYSNYYFTNCIKWLHIIPLLWIHLQHMSRMLTYESSINFLKKRDSCFNKVEK